ncbi:hypothetical protein [Noviherbaspirillum pedocola]|uniref:Uncharacterized protein n=1 Tax=Noviherbaspirillum pedocola TaxID=2801341 RepID=A0A934SVT2_9BURK|nr:hypothetical protein [Noviherbaspirillum pedocola]MBK4736325.1 hypothetical protein [Noviherbaspirillum pedocola]
MEPTLFGISKTEWDLYNSFSNWVSAFATTAAVIVSLYLARKAGRPRAKNLVGHRVVITPGDTGKPPEIIVFKIVNTGDRPIRITSIGWRVGLRKKRYAVQMYEAHGSSPMPIELEHGQEAQWVVPLDQREQGWLEYFAQGMLRPNLWLSSWTLGAQFLTSVGEILMAKPEPGLLNKHNRFRRLTTLMNKPLSIATLELARPFNIRALS